MQQELLFEIGTEEIPAGYITPTRENMARLMDRKLKDLGLAHQGIVTVATPRRLTISVKGLVSGQQDSRQEILGPPRAAAFDGDNKPTKTAEGFARSKGVSMDEIRITETPKGEYLMVVVEKKGESTEKLLPELLTEMITQIPFPKSMRWGSGRSSFARPVQWVLARYGNSTIPCTINNVTSGATTRGHRFMAPGSFETDSLEDYLGKLRQAHVLADPEERRQAVIAEITSRAEKAGGRILPDEDLVDIVTNLVEKPHAVCGTFDRKFLALPKEVLITSMREHQKYFAVVDDAGNLLPNFIAVNNTETRDQSLAVEGHQRVLRARLEDALFFFKEDQNHKLGDRIKDLSGVVFQAGLGTMLEKTDRIEALTGWLAGKIAPDSSVDARRAARLAKTDLLTEIVNEFPSLQGLMGKAYALLEGETSEVADAIAEHYMPVRAGSALPATTIGAMVSLADRIDTITGCFGIGKQPTGTTDPYGLRRLSLGLLHIIRNKGFRISLTELINHALDLYGARITEERGAVLTAVVDFIKGRYTNDRVSPELPITAIEAVTSIDFDDIIDCSLRIDALAAVQGEETFTILAGSFKRVRNIIKDHKTDRIEQTLLTDPAEKVLYQALQEISSEAAPLLEGQNYQKAMEVILKMKEPVDLFFDKVMVMAEDEKIRNNRLALLTSISHLFLKIGDFSRMS
ncbi:MAG: glycine--tRNA ligase subunit beta [Proteobacteria bacterium]|nr:glycine--tRNA ligase subunit beta [Pseudomonadota bacterium]MBU1737748.1 glycine--tRNA ligase subunit beta [Pseudomonadota bacterium]